MCFHPIIPVVGADLKEFRQISVPAVQIDRNRTLPHSQLINSHSGIIDEPNPAQHAAGRTLETADIAAGSPDFSEV